MPSSLEHCHGVGDSRKKYGLRQTHGSWQQPAERVLILVVMEYGLRPHSLRSIQAVLLLVLILVVMEYGLRQGGWL